MNLLKQSDSFQTRALMYRNRARAAHKLQAAPPQQQQLQPQQQQVVQQQPLGQQQQPPASDGGWSNHDQQQNQQQVQFFNPSQYQNARNFRPTITIIHLL